MFDVIGIVNVIGNQLVGLNLCDKVVHARNIAQIICVVKLEQILLWITCEVR